MEVEIVTREVAGVVNGVSEFAQGDNGAYAADAFFDSDEPFGRGVREGPEEHGVGCGEQGGVGSKAEGEGENGDQKERGCVSERAKGESGIGDEVFEPGDVAVVAGLLRDRGDGAERATRGGGGLVIGHA